MTGSEYKLTSDGTMVDFFKRMVQMFKMNEHSFIFAFNYED